MNGYGKAEQSRAQQGKARQGNALRDSSSTNYVYSRRIPWRAFFLVHHFTSFRGLGVHRTTAEVDRRASKAEVFNLGLDVGKTRHGLLWKQTIHISYTIGYWRNTGWAGPIVKAVQCPGGRGGGGVIT